MKLVEKRTVKSVSNKREEKCGHFVYCGQDLRDLIGMTIRDVSSDENDLCVVVMLEDEESRATIHFDNICFDGEHMSIVDEDTEIYGTSLRAVTEDDLQELTGMKRYYDVDIFDDNDEKVGVSHVYCNDIALEGTEGFIIKSLNVYYDGRIFTEE